ncbi:MAG: hypothetical protein AB7S26_22950 [Sandaracinaceae bacterium]
MSDRIRRALEASTSVFYVAIFVAGCTIPDVDLEYRACRDGECPAGLSCDLRGGLPGMCLRMISRTDAGPGRDAGRLVDSGNVPFDGGGASDAGIGNGCGSAAHIFCEDFESGTLDRWSPYVSTGSTVEVTTEAALSGTHSLHAFSSAPEAAAMVYVSAYSAAAPTDQWIRARYLFPARSGPELTFFTLFDDAFMDGVFLNLDTYTLMGWYTPFSMYNVYDDSIGVSIPVDDWVCIEMHVGWGTSAPIEAFVDGALVSQRTGVNTTDRGVLPNVLFGAWGYNSVGPREVFVDDVVISTVPIGCD